MFADSTAEYPPMNAGFFIYVEDADITYNKALDNGATVVTQSGNQSYGRSGGVKDAFGNTWWITSVI
jgi:PhnB protein